MGGKWACAGYASYDLEPRCASLTETCHRFLDLTGPLQLGGLPTLTANFQTRTRHFEGCISDLEIDHRFIDLNDYVTDNNTSSGCPEKRQFCNSNPCRNGGRCVEGWAMYRCVCPPEYGGKDCGEAIGKPWHFSGDGTLSFNPLLRPIQLPWLNALSLRTLQKDAFLMSVQVGQNSSAVLTLQNGFLFYTYNGESFGLNSRDLSDGNWHHVEVTWLGTEIKMSVDYGEYGSLIAFGEKIQGLYVGKILIGGPDNSYTSLNAGYNYLEGCIQDVRIGNKQSILNRPTVKDNVEEGCPSTTSDCQNICSSSATCVTTWGRSECECNDGHVGPDCIPVCDVSPCENNGLCITDRANTKGYRCSCDTSSSGDYCENKQAQPCPASWWGYPVCGPCHCDVSAGYNPDCDKSTGKCRCRENHYQPNGVTVCLPCDCYHVGSYSTQCDHETGQCRCRDGVIGQKCDSCPNAYAEVTLQGCEVVYDGCPRSSSEGIWWPRTIFGQEAVENCPRNAQGRASRMCDNDLGGWQAPDLFNCTSERFVELRQQLSHIEKGELQINTFVAIKLMSDLYKATNLTQNLYGADVLVTFDLIKELLNYESGMHGLNLTHSQDKDYIHNMVHSIGVVLDEKYASHWTKIKKLTGESTENLIGHVENYINILSSSQHDTYTHPFEVVFPNMVLGLDVVTPESLYGYETEVTPSMSGTTERIVIPDTSQFLKDTNQKSSGPLVAFPKYNNYLLDKSKFDQTSKILIPLKLLGIRPIEDGELTTKHSLPTVGAVVSYAQYKQASLLFPETFDESVVRRWGVDITIGSPLISVSVLVPEYVEAVVKTKNDVIFKDVKLPEIEGNEQDMWLKKVLTQPGDDQIHENEAQYLQNQRQRRHVTKKLLYKSLSGIVLNVPVKLQIWLDSNKTVFNERSNPQCVHWSTVRGYGEWSRVGCRTEIDEDWFDSDGPLVVNCSCNHLTTFAVLVDVVDLEV